MKETAVLTCANCRTPIPSLHEQGELHSSPCLDCGSDGHSSCQHAHDRTCLDCGRPESLPCTAGNGATRVYDTHRFG